MSSKSKIKGSRFEREVADFLVSVGFPSADRVPLRGNRDRGDVQIPGWVLELKATRDINLSAALDEARLEAKNAGVMNWAAVVKRRGKGTKDAYFVLPLEDAARLIAELGGLK